MVHVDHFFRQTDHLEAAVVAGPLRVTFEDENYEDRIIRVVEDNEDREHWFTKTLKSSNDITWLDKAQLATTLWQDIPIKVQEEDNLFIHQVTINLYETSPKFVLVILYNNENIYMSQRIHKNKPMYLKYQVPCGKTEPGEMRRKAAKREVAEETNLYIEDE